MLKRKKLNEAIGKFKIIYKQELLNVLLETNTLTEDEKIELFEHVQWILVNYKLLEGYLVDVKLLSFLENNYDLKGLPLYKFLWFSFKKKLNEDLIDKLVPKINQQTPQDVKRNLEISKEVIETVNERVIKSKIDLIKYNNKLILELRNCEKTFKIKEFKTIKNNSLKLVEENYNAIEKQGYEFSEEIIDGIITELSNLQVDNPATKTSSKETLFKNIESNKRLENLIFKNFPNHLTEEQLVKFFLNEYKIKHNERRDSILETITGVGREQLFKDEYNTEVKRKYLETIKRINDLKVNKKYINIKNGDEKRIKGMRITPYQNPENKKKEITK